MVAEQLKKEYIDFFVKRGHKKLPNVSLVPENDPTTLFISAGMQPLVPYLLGAPHPLGKRLVSVQRCLRTGDIAEVGNVFHNTFFEMLGNWSLGDYWKRESLAWSYEFLTKILGLDPKRFHVTVFKGDRNAPRDSESEKIWLSLGIPKERIYPLPKEDNWWEAGETGPGGPDSEIFYDIGKPACGSGCRPGDGCGRFFEMWNNVFMEYNRKSDGSYEKLEQKNVDTGMGVERTTAVLENRDDIYQTGLFTDLIHEIEEISGEKYQGEHKKPMRIIADHLRAATFVIAEGIAPSNVDRGYVLRRLIRRAIRHARLLGIKEDFTPRIAQIVVGDYGKIYPALVRNQAKIFYELNQEEEKFGKTLKKGLKKFEKTISQLKENTLPGEEVFHLYDTFGFPFELTCELAKERGLKVDEAGFKKALAAHQEKSRAGAAKKFVGGLAERGVETTKLHTATHLLHQALRDVLGSHVRQAGSNITPQRLRFDFNHPKKLTEKEVKDIEKIVNQKIAADLPVKFGIMSLEEARKQGALAFFGEKYPEKIKVYFIGSYSKEVCGGPHVSSTGELGRVKIIKSESIGSGIQRIYAVLT